MSAPESHSPFQLLRAAAFVLACTVQLAPAGAQQRASAAHPATHARQEAPAEEGQPAGIMRGAAAMGSVPLPGSAMSAGTAAEIQRINEQMTLLQAQLNQLELKAKIASKQKEINVAAPVNPLPSAFGSRNGNPSVLSVAGLKGQLEAVLVFPGGVTQRVRAGDVIDDRRVAKVALTEVVLTDLKGRTVQRLAFGSNPITRELTPLAATGLQPAPLFPLPASMPGVPAR